MMESLACSLSLSLSLSQAAAQCYIELIVKESDNNIKLIVLDRLRALKDSPTHKKVLEVYNKYNNTLMAIC